MGLNPGDLDKIPKSMSVKDCYERIFNWHKKHLKTRVKEKYGHDNVYSRAYLDLVYALPSPSEATQGDMDFIFCEVISGLMEWSYHQEDEYGIKIAAYAHFALNKQYAGGFHNEEVGKSRETSKLFSEFGYYKLKEKYEKKDR